MRCATVALAHPARGSRAPGKGSRVEIPPGESAHCPSEPHSFLIPPDQLFRPGFETWPGADFSFHQGQIQLTHAQHRLHLCRESANRIHAYVRKLTPEIPQEIDEMYPYHIL